MAGKKHISVPIRIVGGDLWGELNLLAFAHEICGETVRCTNPRFTFAGQHRVQLFQFKKNVHWKIPAGVTLDISEVPPEGAPARRQPPRRR